MRDYAFLADLVRKLPLLVRETCCLACLLCFPFGAGWDRVKAACLPVPQVDLDLNLFEDEAADLRKWLPAHRARVMRLHSQERKVWSVAFVPSACLHWPSLCAWTRAGILYVLWRFGQRRGGRLLRSALCGACEKALLKMCEIWSGKLCQIAVLLSTTIALVITTLIPLRHPSFPQPSAFAPAHDTRTEQKQSAAQQLGATHLTLHQLGSANVHIAKLR